MEGLQRHRLQFALFIASCLPSCVGQVAPDVGGDPHSGDYGGSGGAANETAPGGFGQPAGTSCGARGPGSWSMRRLTRLEYNNTVADLLGDPSDASAAFPPDQILIGFDNNAGAAGVSDLLVEKYETAAGALATKATQDPKSLMQCKAGEAEDDCARRFIATFGLRALRRPLQAAERTRYSAFYDLNKSQFGFAAAVRMLVEAFLQSPSFVYRTELSAVPSQTANVKVSPYELASRLSYLLWSSMPDANLFAVAESGALAQPGELAKQARRMLGDKRAAKGIANFYGQWLGTNSVMQADKDPTTFPKWTKDIPSLLRQETETFVGSLANGGVATLNDLFRASYSYMNKDLAAFYGVVGPTGTQFEKVMLNPAQRFGILTQGSVLASNASPRQTNPVKRGYYVRERFLCAPPPPPPADLKVSPPPPDGNRTTRERFAEHRRLGGSCEGCHKLMDPVGLGFEHYDGVGLWRDADVGRPVDASGEVFDTVDIDGPFDGAAALAMKLASSEQVASCLVRQHFRFAFGRGEQEADTCTLLDLQKAFAKTGGNLGELMVALTQTEPFLLRAANNEAMP